jgi:hypothetical protein
MSAVSPLAMFPQRRGDWRQKVRGKWIAFGRVSHDPAGIAALDQRLDQRGELLAGRPPGANAEGVS